MKFGSIDSDWQLTVIGHRIVSCEEVSREFRCKFDFSDYDFKIKERK
jgi:hypothetical protein